MDVSSSSSSAMSTLAEYDVFLSFRVEDTRDKFTSHLHTKFIQKSIDTYIDSRLDKGDTIPEELPKAIRGSKISVTILSENYANSSWCLDELVCILKCKKEEQQIVVPVFYDVQPTHIRKQLNVDQPFFKEHIDKGRADKVDEWRTALEDVAKVTGWDSLNKTGKEAEFVDDIAKDILLKLYRLYSPSEEFEDLVGIDKSIEEMDQLLCISDSTTVSMIGISGMGGLGKTTLARVLFQRLSSKFQGCCFLENVREESRKHDGLESLKRKLFYALFEENNLHSPFSKQKLRRKKVLIMLDDVDNPEQIQALAADLGSFGLGSRIIVTTRDASVFRNREYKQHELKVLGPDDALQLFISHAFERSYSLTADDETLSKSVVTYAGGNPLALKVLGPFFRSKRKENWQSELNKLKEFPNKSIHDILKISFNGLDETEREIFLDIVCFFGIGLVICRKCIERRLGAHRSYVDIGIDSLIDKSLITVKDNNLVIHDLLKEMGQKIEEQQRTKEPGKLWRLWTEEDFRHVLNTGTPTIEGISCSINIGDLSRTIFKEMNRLWLLDLSRSRLEFSQGVHYLPNSLKCLIWNFWPCKSLPSTFMPHNLVELRMPYSSLEKLWSGVQVLGNLKYVDLSFSESLAEISTLSKAPNLVSVDLTGCGSLRKVPLLRFQISDDLSLDQSLHKCNRDGCQTLGHLKLDCCINLRVVENISGNLKELHLSVTSVADLPTSIWSLDNLVYLNLSECESLKSLPNDIWKLKSLKRLDLSECSSLDKLPNVIGCLSSLEKISLDGNNIEEIPASIINLSKLIELSICNCKRLQFLPELPLSLELLDASGCISLQTISNSRDFLEQGLGSDNHVMMYRKFFYADCLKLDQNTRNNIFREFQLRTLATSIKPVLPDGVLNKSNYPSVYISCPGNKIPMWFTNRLQSSSLNVPLSWDWLNTNFLGFALCAVVAGDISHLNLSCEANFKTNRAKIYEVHWDFNNFDTNYDRFKTRNLFMWYKHQNFHDYRDAVEVSFRFKAKYSPEGTVRACGIRLLHCQDAVELVENQLL